MLRVFYFCRSGDVFKFFSEMKAFGVGNDRTFGTLIDAERPGLNQGHEFTGMYRMGRMGRI